MATSNKGCGVQRVVRSETIHEEGKRIRWRCYLACGHALTRRQDKPPSQACCEKKERQQQPPRPVDVKARRAILQALLEVPGMSSVRLLEEVVSASMNRAAVAAERVRLTVEGRINGGSAGRWLTDAGRAELAERRAA